MVGRVGTKKGICHQAKPRRAEKSYDACHRRGRDAYPRESKSPWGVRFRTDRHALAGHRAGLRAHIHAVITPATGHLRHRHAGQSRR